MTATEIRKTFDETEQQQHAAQLLRSEGFKPAGPEWTSALFRAQKAAKRIERSKGIPDKSGRIKFHVAPAEDFTHEGRRCLHPEGLGWFRACTVVSELNPHMGTLKLTGCYVVFHEPTNQARACYVDWGTKADGDAMASAHTRLARRFLQDLLCIPVVDEGLAPDDPPSNLTPGCPHPRDRHVVNPDTSVVCTLCGEILGYAPPPAPQQQGMFPQQPPPPPQPPMPQQQQQQAQPPVPQQQTQLAPPPPQGPGQPAPPPQQFQDPPLDPQAQHHPPAQQAPPTPTGPLPPIQDSLIVQGMQQALGAEQITQKQMNAELAPAPASQAAKPGEPTTPDDWRKLLVENGMDEENATQIALLNDQATVELPLVDDMRNWAWSHYAGNSEAMQKAWIDVGFTPVTGMPIDQRPRPTGIQTKRFLSQMKFAPK